MSPARRYQGLVCDLDGVVYRGREACPGAVEGLRHARSAGVRVLFLTNNAGHTAAGIAEHLTELGVAASPEEVLTSSQVAAEHLAAQWGVGSPRRDDRSADLAPDGSPVHRAVLAVGGPGVRVALEAAGLTVVTPQELGDGHRPPVQAVVQGYGPDVAVRDLTEAAYAVAEGATWIATNSDPTLPTARGLAPGNGSLLAAVAHATGRTPDIVVGKPHAPAYERALAALGLPADAVLAVGDRLETDIAGARAAGLATALVLTGVHGRADVEAAPDAQRPDTVVETLPQLRQWWG